MKIRLAPSLVVALALSSALARAQPPDELLAIGIKQVEEGDFQSAVGTLEGVAREMAADKTRSKDLARAYVYMAIAYVGLSQEATAKAKFLEAWRNDAGLKLSPRDFPPRVIQTFQQAIQEARDVAVDPASVGPFLEAVKRDDVAAVRRMLQREPALLYAAEPGSGATPLHWATLRGHLLTVAFLVGAGADLTATNGSGETPIDVARRAKHESLSPWLLFAGVGLPPGPNEAFDAAKRGDVGRLRQILAADPEAVGRKDPEFGATPLHWAALRGNAATVAFLLGAGADTVATNHSGETPLTVCQRAGKGKTRIAEVLAP
jgi:hypothetical protein